jgi:hypothetical protein
MPCSAWLVTAQSSCATKVVRTATTTQICQMKYGNIIIDTVSSSSISGVHKVWYAWTSEMRIRDLRTILRGISRHQRNQGYWQIDPSTTASWVYYNDWHHYARRACQWQPGGRSSRVSIPVSSEQYRPLDRFPYQRVGNVRILWKEALSLCDMAWLLKARLAKFSRSTLLQRTLGS